MSDVFKDIDGKIAIIEYALKYNGISYGDVEKANSMSMDAHEFHRLMSELVNEGNLVHPTENSTVYQYNDDGSSPYLWLKDLQIKHIISKNVEDKINKESMKI